MIYVNCQFGPRDMMTQRTGYLNGAPSDDSNIPEKPTPTTT